MDAIDTSPEAVERLASLSDVGISMPGWKWHQDIAATLRALRRERDEARYERGKANREMCRWQAIAGDKDIIIKQLEAERDAAWQAGAEAMREVLIGGLEAQRLHISHAKARDYPDDMLRFAEDAIADARALPIPERPE